MRSAFARQWAAEGQSDWTRWRITPIEYKCGQPKKDDSDRVQICAQAMCLEEMLSVQIASGALFYGQRRRRTDVVFDESLRQRTEQATRRFRDIIETVFTPPHRP